MVPLRVERERMILGSRAWPIGTERRICVEVDPTGSGGGNLVVNGRPFAAVVEPNDEVSFKREAGWLIWPTFPIRYSIMNIVKPRRRRFVYDRLVWIKPSGDRLDLAWRDRQDFFGGGRVGWSDANVNAVAWAVVYPGRAGIAVEKHLFRTRNWTPADYQLEWARVKGALEVRVKAAEDDDADAPGSGRSVILRVEGNRAAVIEERAFQ